MFEIRGFSIPIFANGTGWYNIYWQGTKKVFCQCGCKDVDASKEFARRRAERLVILLNDHWDNEIADNK